MSYLYVCHFSSGHIKVGRSVDPKSRVAQHADRVACIGVELVEYRTFECAGSAVAAERALIQRCDDECVERLKSEWFTGVGFCAACAWAADAAINAVGDSRSGVGASADAELIDKYGGCVAVAARLGFGPNGAQRVSNWKTRGIPAAIKLAYPWLRGAKPVPTELTHGTSEEVSA